MPRDTLAGMAKLETVYGDASALLPASDGFIYFELDRQPEISDLVNRRVQRPFAGAAGKRAVNRRVSASFGIELAGSGAAAVPLPYAHFLQALGGFGAPVINGTTDVTYPLISQPASGVWPSLSLATYVDDVRVRARGMRANNGGLTFNYEVGQDPFVRCEALGLYVAAADKSAPGTIDISKWRTPVEVSTNNTRFTLAGKSVALSKATIGINMITEYFNAVNKEEIYVSKSDEGDVRAISGEFEILCPDLADYNFYANINNRVPMLLSHGVGAGNIVEFESTRFQIQEVSEGRSVGQLALTIKGQFVPDAAGNELTLRSR
jgi:hypothetical protein